MSPKLELNVSDLTHDSQYQNPVTLTRGYESDGRNSQRDSINAYYRQLTGRQFSNYWQWQGIDISLISQLQFTRFIVDSELIVIGRDIFLRDYEIESAVIWAMVFNAMQTNLPVEFESNGRHIAAYRTETGKRSYHGKSDDGTAKLKSFNRTVKKDGRKGRKSPRKNK